MNACNAILGTRNDELMRDDLKHVQIRLISKTANLKLSCPGRNYAIHAD